MKKLLEIIGKVAALDTLVCKVTFIVKFKLFSARR